MSKYFAGRPGQARARRASDALAILIGFALLLWAVVGSGTTTEADQWVSDMLAPLPSWFDQIWRIGYFLGPLLLLAIFIGALRGKRRDLVRDMTLAMLAASAIGVAIALLVGDSFPTVFPEFESDPESAFPILRLGVVTGAVVAAFPSLTRPVRILGWSVLLLVAMSSIGIGLGDPTDAVGTFGIGLIAASSILLIFGSPKGYPDIDAVKEALAELGVYVVDLTLVPAQSWGVRTMAGSQNGGVRIEVLAYGRDAADTRMAAKLWRALWYRGADGTVSFSRLESVEHNALVGLVAADHGVNTQKLLAVGMAGDDVAVLARTAAGTPLTEPTFEEAREVWREVVKVHEAGIAHGSLTLSTVSVDDGRMLLGDFAGASFNATRTQRSLDIVSLLYETAVTLGAEAAVAAASGVVPREHLVESIAYMQVPALNPEQRKLISKPKALVKEIQQATVEATDSDVPEPAKLRRIRPKDMAMPLLSLVAFSALIGMLADVDFQSVWAVVQDASWILFVVAFFVAHIAFFFDATGTLFATGYALPMKPLVVLQLGVRWIGLAVPSAAGRVGMNTVFLRKYGVPPTMAITQGAVDSLSNFVLQCVILVIAILAVDIPIDVDTGDVDWALIVLVVVILVVGSLLAIFRIKRVHDAVIPAIRDGWSALAGVLKSPKRTIGLFGSNLASMTLLALSLLLILESIGTPLPLITCLVVVVATSLLAGIVPIPGGIGVAEATMTALLTAAGIDQNAAFAAAVVWRACTFYVPAGEGFFATQWLQEGDYV